MPEAGVPLARAFARLTIDVADAGTSVQSAVRKAGESGQKEAESQASKIRGKLAQGFEFGAGFYGGEALLRGVSEGIKSVIESADQLTERTENVDRVFGESSATVLKFGQDAAKSYGLSAVAADQMSVKLGALFTNLGIGQGEAAKMSEKLVGLAADLAAFNHTDTASAEQALQNALSGRTQSLKQYGIVVDAVTIQQQAMKDGLIANVKDALTPAERAQAAYEVILQRSTVQQGQFQRSSGSLAEQTQILKAEVTDASAAVGQKLIPVLVDGAKGLQDLGRGAASVVDFFEHNSAAATILAGVLGAALIPKLVLLTVEAERFVAAQIGEALSSSAGGIRAIGAAIAATPDLYGLTAALAAAGVAVELFGSHEKSVALDVGTLTDAVKQQIGGMSNSVEDNLINQFSTDKIHDNRGDTVLAYLQRYKIDVNALTQELAQGGGEDALTKLFNQPNSILAKITNDQSINPNVYSGIVEYFKKIIGTVDATSDAEHRAALVHEEVVKQLESTPQGQFILYLGSVQKAQDALTKSSADNNKTISGQIDLLKQYSAQADVTAASIQKALLNNITTLAGEGGNLQTLSANGVDGDFIKKLVAEGPEYVAAVASASKQVQLQLSQQFAAGQTQLVHTSDEAARAELPKQAALVAGAANLGLQAQTKTMQSQFFAAVSAAVDQAKTIAGDGGRETASAFGARGEAGRNAVLQSFLKTLPDPVRIAAQSALGIATDAGGKLPQNLAGAIISHIPRATNAAEALRLAVQNRIDLLHGKTIDVITQDNASGALFTISQHISQLEALNNTLKATRITGADGGFVSGPGGPRDDVIPAWLSNEEHVTNAPSANVNRALLAWMDKHPGDRVPGFADGGPVTDQIATHPFVQSFADYLSGGAFAALLSGASGGASNSQSVQAWAPTILQALGLAGAPASWLSAEETIMRLESGGNPTIQNLGYTAGGGHPTGLMQMLPATFLAHALPGLGNIVNGLDNLVSSIRYQESEYGSPFNIPGVVRGSYGGYDHGGVLPPGTTVAYNGTGRPENVQTAQQRDELLAEQRRGNRLLADLLAAMRKSPAATGAAVGGVLNGTARSGNLDRRTRTVRR